MKYSLTEDMRTGYYTIDLQHNELFTAINDLLEACTTGKGRQSVAKTSQFLTSYVDKHFAEEEALQLKTNYPQYIAHKKFHDSYKSKLKEDLKILDREGVSIASLAIVNSSMVSLISHIKMEDKKLAKHIQSAL